MQGWLSKKSDNHRSILSFKTFCDRTVSLKVECHEIKVRIMTPNELLMLVVLLSPGILLSVLIMLAFAAGG